MSTWRRRVAVLNCALVLLPLGGCAVNPPAMTQLTPSASASPQVDFTAPGATDKILAELMKAADTDQLIMVEVSRSQASISVVKDKKSQTWAYREGGIKQVESDTAYVDQAIFDIHDFNLADVAGLFREAAAVSGSAENQQLQIVDYSGGEVMMTVSTLPESRTVFFHPDGKMLATLDFQTREGVVAGLKDAIGAKNSVLSVGVQSDLGAYVDYPGPDETTVRRQRTAKVPTTTNPRAETPNLPLFNPNKVSAQAIWAVIERARKAGDLTPATNWSVIVDDRERTGAPLMHFIFGTKREVTDLRGAPQRDR